MFSWLARNGEEMPKRGIQRQEPSSSKLGQDYPKNTLCQKASCNSTRSFDSRAVLSSSMRASSSNPFGKFAKTVHSARIEALTAQDVAFKKGRGVGGKVCLRLQNLNPQTPDEPLSKLLVSPLLTPILVPYIIPHIAAPLRSLDYSSDGFRV